MDMKVIAHIRSAAEPAEAAKVEKQIFETSQTSAKRSRLKTPLLGALTVGLSVLLIFTIVKAAGSLTPPGDGTPARSGYTLDDIYTRLTTNETAIVADHAFAPTGDPAASFHTLSEIYSAIPTIDPGKVATSTSYLGVSGTLLGNMFNGSCHNDSDPDSICPDGEFPGGSQTQGGVDDYNGYNLGGPRPEGSYATTWTQCNIGNNYCNTGDPGANAKDEATGLVWSFLCKGEGCSSWNTETDPEVLTEGCLPDGNCTFWDDPFTNPNADALYSWDDSGTPKSWYTGNGGKTASALCSQTHTVDGHDYDGWLLPSQKQLMQAYIDGSYGNLEPLGVGRDYWSSTTESWSASNAWSVSLSDGYTYGNYKSGSSSVRCVRPAN